MFINMEFLVIFGAPWNKRGRWVLSGTGVSGCKSKDLLPHLTLCDFQGSNDQVIEEVNSYVSCWISKVASTRIKDGEQIHITWAGVERRGALHVGQPNRRKSPQVRWQHAARSHRWTVSVTRAAVASSSLAGRGPIFMKTSLSQSLPTCECAQAV